MGVTIYYRGVLKDPGSVEQLINEVGDIAKSNNWKYHILNDPWDAPVTVHVINTDEDSQLEGNAGLKGIVLDPHPDLGGLSLLFDQEGTCRTIDEMAQPPGKRTGVSHVSTQYAGLDMHMQLVHFLEYVGVTYMQEWQIEDDSGYHTHHDPEKAKEIFDAVEDAIDAVTEAFDTIEIPDDLEGREEEFLAMVEKRIRTYLPGVEIKRIDEEE